MSKKLLFIIEFVYVLGIVLEGVESFGMDRRSAAPDRSSEDYPDYQLGVKYDEYPMVVPKKRTAMLVNRLLVALKEAMDEEEREEAERNTNRINSKKFSKSPEDIRSMDLIQRRGDLVGQPKGRVYWRCYFNAVTCF